MAGKFNLLDGCNQYRRLLEDSDRSITKFLESMDGRLENVRSEIADPKWPADIRIQWVALGNEIIQDRISAQTRHREFQDRIKSKIRRLEEAWLTAKWWLSE